MPCYCWYDPPEESKKIIKNCCQQIVDELKRLQEEGDPIGWKLDNVHELLNHLYDPRMCKERKIKDATHWMPLSPTPKE